MVVVVEVEEEVVDTYSLILRKVGRVYIIVTDIKVKGRNNLNGRNKLMVRNNLKGRNNSPTFPYKFSRKLNF